MIRNLNQVSFQGFGVVPPERNQQDKNSETPYDVWKLAKDEGELYQALDDTWISCDSGTSVLSVSRDGDTFQHFYLDKPVWVRQGIVFGLRAFLSEASVKLSFSQAPQLVGKRSLDSIRVDRGLQVECIYTFFYQEKEQGFVFPGESHPMAELTYVDQGELHSVADGQDLLLKQGDLVAVSRTEHGEEGIYLHSTGFGSADDESDDQFVFRQGRSRETSYARDYDRLFELLKYEKEHGNILWVMGPAFSFDADARRAMQAMVENGYVDGLMAGNALATHDLEGAMFHTALGQDIYTQKSQPNGHYNHLDVINRVRRSGSIAQFIDDYNIDNGIMYSCVKNDVPFVLTGSIRDDGPLPEVIGNAYDGQTAMRNMVKKATTVVCLATMLHTIATGNMTPSYRVMEDGTVRPVFLYTVDADEFVVNKLLDRGSLSATTIVTNVQDFIMIVAKGLGLM